MTSLLHDVNKKTAHEHEYDHCGDDHHGREVFINNHDITAAHKDGVTTNQVKNDVDLKQEEESRTTDNPENE
jgi:hypothetical protein